MLCNGGKRFSYKYPNIVLLGGMNLPPSLVRAETFTLSLAFLADK
jgi:hypothetical protein